MPSAHGEVQRKSGHIKLEEGYAVAYEYYDAGSAAPIVVTLTGLIYPLSNLNEFADALAAKNISSLRIAFSTQAESIRKFNEFEDPYFMDSINPLSFASTTQVTESSLINEVVRVIQHLQVSQRQIYLATLSYSGFLAEALLNQYGELFKGHLMYSPGMKPSHRYNSAGEAAHNSYMTQLNIPFANLNPYYMAGVDKSYDVFVQNSMYGVMNPKRDNPGYVPAGLTFEQFFAGIFCLARAVKYTDLTESEEDHNVRTRLILASKEEPALLKDQLRYFFKSEASKELYLVKDAYHGIPGAHPQIAAQLLEDFIGNPAPGTSKSGTLVDLEGALKTPLTLPDLRLLEQSL